MKGSDEAEVPAATSKRDRSLFKASLMSVREAAEGNAQVNSMFRELDNNITKQTCQYVYEMIVDIKRY